MEEYQTGTVLYAQDEDRYQRLIRFNDRPGTRQAHVPTALDIPIRNAQKRKDP